MDDGSMGAKGGIDGLVDDGSMGKGKTPPPGAKPSEDSPQQSTNPQIQKSNDSAQSSDSAQSNNPAIQQSNALADSPQQSKNPQIPQSAKPSMPTTPARQDEDTPIAPGADPDRNPGLANPWSAAYQQSGSRQMPVPDQRPRTTDHGQPQVNDAAGWSVTGLQSPALGYSIPNDQLATLGKIGLGNSRAAQALRRSISNSKFEISNPVPLSNSAPAKEAAPIVQLRTAHIDDLAPVRHALAAIENISDGVLFLKKLREFADDHGPLIPLLHDINAYPKAAKVLNDFTTSKLAAALKNPPKGIKS
jgi:hypothetical protein